MLSVIHGHAVRNLIYVAASEADVSKLAVVHECKLFRRTAGFAPNAESSDGLIEHPCGRMWRGETVPGSNCCSRRYDPYAPRRMSLILRGHDT